MADPVRDPTVGEDENPHQKSFYRTLHEQNVEDGVYSKAAVGNPYKLFINQPDQERSVTAFLPESFSWNVTSDYDTPFVSGVDISSVPIAGNFISKIGGTGISGDGIFSLLDATLLGSKRYTSQMLSMQVWQGSSPVDFSIPMHFLHEKNTETDVVSPLRTLMKMALPHQSNNFTLYPPGPKLDFSNFNSSTNDTPSESFRLDIGQNYREKFEKFTTSLLGETSEDRSFLENLGVDTTEEATAFIAEKKIKADIFVGEFLSRFGVKDNIILSIGEYMLFPSVVITNVSSEMETRLDRRRKKPTTIQVTVDFRSFVTPLVGDLDVILPS